MGSAYCPCKDGYYRHPRDGKHMPCYRPPGPPTNLTLLFMESTTPCEDSQLFDSKYRSDVVFKVRCQACNSNAVFNPLTDTCNDTKLTLTNLEPVTTYTIQIHSLNGVSYSIHADENETDESNDGGKVKVNGNGHHSSISLISSSIGSTPDENQIKIEFTEITFTTEPAILSTNFNARIVSITSEEIDLIWDKPVHSDSPIEFYEVRWFLKSEIDTINKTTLSTKDTKAHIDNLMENTEYGFLSNFKKQN